MGGGGTRPNPNGRDLGPSGAGRPVSPRLDRQPPLLPPARGLGDCETPPRNARAAISIVTGKPRPPSAKGKGRGRWYPGGPNSSRGGCTGGTEDVPSRSPVSQILWEPERESHRLSEPQFPHLPNGGNIIGSKFPEELFRG